MPYIFSPYEGVGDLKFSMVRKEVHLILNAPARHKKSRFSDEVTDFWHDNNLQIAFDSKSDNLLEISLYPGIGPVIFKGTDIFEPEQKTVLQSLMKIDGDPKNSSGIIILLNLGLALSGFEHDDQDQRSISAFKRGRWSSADFD